MTTTTTQETTMTTTATTCHNCGLAHGHHAPRCAEAPADRRPCYHPLSCRACDLAGEPCGAHFAGEAGHKNCTGRAPKPTQADATAPQVADLQALTTTALIRNYGDLRVWFAVNETTGPTPDGTRKHRRLCAVVDELRRRGVMEA